MRKIILIVLLSAMCGTQISCKKDEKTSILIIAVDELTTPDVNCNQDENPKSGFQMLCQESVRFTHAFTPSVLTTPALSSLLTGLYPYQHKVRHNGGPDLAAEFELVSEVAYRKNYRTSFFSGGAPILRRSGLNQGFEVFDDSIIPNWNFLFRPLSENAKAFLNWLDDDAADQGFFSVLYAPDLLYVNTETFSELGEARNLSFESLASEMDESLHELFTELKKRNRWDSTYIFLVGLNGHTSSDRWGEISPLNLHGENTQVALLIKPTQSRKRDQSINWKVDQNVSLTDIGHTLFEILGESFVDQQSPLFPTFSLMPALKSPTATWPEDRLILIESGWALWRQAGPLKSAAISGPILYIHDEKPQLYNTLVDRFEVNPLPLLQQSILGTTSKIRAALNKTQFVPFPPLNPEWQSKLSIPYSRWVRSDQEKALLQDLKRLSQQRKASIDLQNWAAQIALNRKSWEDLRVIGERNQIPSWVYVAERNKGGKLTPFAHPCFDLLRSETLETSQLRACSDPLFLEFIDWLRADTRKLNKDAQRRRFERSFQSYMLDQQIQRFNIASGLIWDTSRENIFAPSNTELALSLPEYTKVRNQVYRSLTTPLPNQ